MTDDYIAVPTGLGPMTKDQTIHYLLDRIEELELALREAWPYVPDHHGPVQHKIKTARREALEEAAAYHDAEVVRLEETIASNSAYLERIGQGTDDYSNDLCRNKQAMHRMHAAAIRALKEKE